MRVLEFNYRLPRRGPSLKKIHTRVLLKYLDAARIGGCGSDWFWNHVGHAGWTVEQLKAELATREHVPNKVEAKVLRQKLAKAKRNR